MDDEKADLLKTLHVDRTDAPPRRSWRWVGLAAGILLSVGLALVAAWSVVREQMVPVRVAVAHALPGANAPAPGTSRLDATGYVVARRQATVGPKIAGKLRDVLVEEGMHVEAGQVIAHLDDSNALAALIQAKATLEQAETTAADQRPLFERSRLQVEKGLVSHDSYDTAKGAFDQTQTAAAVARAAYAVARQNADDTVVTAPFAGVVTAKAAQPGEIISPVSAGAGFTRTGIATIVDMDSLEADVDVSENFINRVHPEQHCTVTLNAYPDWHVAGHVIAVVPQADRAKATLPVRVALDERDPRILPEMGVRVSFLTDATPGRPPAPVGVMVPSEAIAPVSFHQGMTVFVVRNGHVERRPVALGPRTADGQIVLSGLSDGETVAVSDLERLEDGTKVRIEQ